MTTLNDMVDEVLLNLSSYGLTQPRLTSLSSSLDASTTIVNVASATGVPVGLVEVGSELMYVQAADTAANQLTVTRGYHSTATTHASGALLTVNPAWPRRQVVTALNDAITSSYPQLFKVGTTTLTASGTVNTYDLAGAKRVLQVRNLAIGPTQEWLRVKRWRLDADLAKLTIYTSLVPNTSIHVAYTTQPTQLAADTDLLTASGLQDSAKPYVVLAACAQLVLHMDSSRLPVNSASADDMENNRSVGTATSIAKVLISRAEMELAKERTRLTQQYPATISLSTRGRV